MEAAALPPSAEALPADDALPANPFGAVTDGDLEYFVDWSIEHSTGEHDAAPRPTALGALASQEALDVTAAVPPPRVLHPGLHAAVGIALLASLCALALWQRPRAAPATPVAVAPTPPPAPAVAAPAPAVAAPAPTTAPPPAAEEAQVELAIATRPNGALVSVDGKPAGSAPLRVQVAPGPHQVVVTRARYEKLVTEVAAPGRVDLPLARPTATLAVTSSSGGAEVRVRGASSGKTPFRAELAAYKSYEVQVSSGGKTWKKKIYLKPPLSELHASL
jgi:hypothetical protein